MNCETAKERLELSFGDETLSAELTAHLQECDNCAACHDEILALATGLGDDDSFFTPAELEQAAREVETKIMPAPVVSVTGWPWMQLMLRVAAVVTLVAASVVSFKIGQQSLINDPATSATAFDYEYGSLASLYVEDLEENLDDNVISVLIDEYVDDGSFGAGESLVGDISEEEFEYLMNNFEVGELL